MKNTHRPNKNLGQNFLIDTRIQRKIIDICQLQATDHVLEIGPGKGAITRLIFPLVNQLTVVEKDPALASLLKEEFKNSSLKVIEGDFLKQDFKDQASLVVIGNIPYNISTPIIEKLIAQREKVKKAFLMVQLEFGERLAAKEGSKDYGSLSCYLQYYFEAHILFKISPGSFHPQPKVQSCFVSLIPRSKPILQVSDETGLFKFIQTAFMQRRKTFANAIKGFANQEDILSELNRLNINPRARPEEISLLNFIKIYNSLVI